MTDANVAAQGLNVTALLEATHDGESQVGHGLDLLGEREVVHESNPTAGTVVGIVAETVETAHARIYEQIDEREAVHALLDDIAAGQEIVVVVLQILTILLGRTLGHPVAAAVIDLAIETKIGIEKRITRTGTGTETEKEIVREIDGADRDLAPVHRLCHTRPPRMS